MGRLQTVGLAAPGRGIRKFEPVAWNVRYGAILLGADRRLPTHFRSFQGPLAAAKSVAALGIFTLFLRGLVISRRPHLVKR